MDLHPRTKKGQPPHNTTGVAKIHSIHCQVFGGANRARGERNGAISDIAISRRGTVSAEQIQNRLFISRSSGFFSSSVVTVLGSSAIPQMGHEPGSPLTISGCMGHVYSVFVAGLAARTGSRAIPHLGQSPGPCWRTSGSIGQVYSFAFFVTESGIGTSTPGASCACEGTWAGAICKGFDDAGAMPTRVFETEV